MLILSLPSIVAGLVIARISITRLSMYFGVLGIAVGCWWHIHLSVLGASVTRGYAVQDRLVSIERLDGHSLTRWLVNAEYDLLVHGGSVFGIVMLLLPLLSALMAVCTMNYWVRCWRGAGVSDR
jgi:hypothetical protein